MADEYSIDWDAVRAAISEGFCPAHSGTCGRRLQPWPELPREGAGGRCPKHGPRWVWLGFLNGQPDRITL